MASKIAVQLLVGQQEEPFLPYAIKSVPWVDYFTVVNTAPESYWGQINQQIIEDTITELGQELRYRYLPTSEDGVFSFAEARNKCLEMTDPDDMVLILDADDVHFPYLEEVVKKYLAEGADSITAHFFHLMVYKNIFQFVQPREIFYKNYPGTCWVNGVHELLANDKRWPVVSSYHYMHYGYIKPQSQVFERWKFYSELEGDYHHYDGQDPDNIISDRISVSKPLPLAHPPVIRNFLESYPECPRGTLRENSETAPMEKVGLILLAHNDEDNLKECLQTLTCTLTHPQFEILAIDMASTDNSLRVLDSYKEVIEMQIYEVSELLSLTEALNFGFNHFRQRYDIQYIGWIHPDMKFMNMDWLFYLYQELIMYPKIGKICASNTRDNIPSELIPGHEQCYILRKDIINKVGLFDEKYIGIGGYEDWDMNQRILNHGYKVMISPRSQVFHAGMQTRQRRDTTQEQIHNAQYYHSKWLTDKAPV